ncbi:hypothetical protein ONZ45_g10658 [Pleurotus djamor]|nr:hypothetical protein ONZ45_g10658 [Pleurotus djamor]
MYYSTLTPLYYVKSRLEQHRFVETVLNSYDVQEEIFGCLSMTRLIALSMTCRTMHALIKRYEAKKRNIERHLAAYFPHEHISSFRQLQSTTSLLIGGLFALRLLDWTLAGSDDEALELYVYHEDYRQVTDWMEVAGCTLEMPYHPGQSAEDILTHKIAELPFTLCYAPKLDDEAEYQGVVMKSAPQALRQKFADEQIQDVSGATSNIVVLQYLTPSNKRIQVYVNPISALAGVLGATSTGLMSFVSAHHVYCPFARETLKKHIVLCLLAECRTFDDLRVYREDGFWKIISSDRERERYNVFQGGFHGIGGENCLRVPIGNEGLANATDEVLHESGFDLEFLYWAESPGYIAYDSGVVFSSVLAN